MNQTIQKEPKIRCAIYTRNDMNEAQRLCCEEFIRGKDGWVCIPTRYDDDSESTRYYRPGLLALIRDVNADKVDCIVMYKFDRLVLSFADFLGLVDEIFEQRNVFLASATEPLDTSTETGGELSKIFELLSKLN